MGCRDSPCAGHEHLGNGLPSLVEEQPAEPCPCEPSDDESGWTEHDDRVAALAPAPRSRRQ